MAAKTSKPNPSSKKGKVLKNVALRKKQDAPFSPYSLVAVELFTSAVKRTAGVEPKGEPEFTIGAEVNQIEHFGETSVGFVDLRVAKTFNNEANSEATFAIEACYLLQLTVEAEIENEIRDSYLAFAAVSSVWPRFIDLFNSITSQHDIKFPPLPIQPPQMKIKAENTELAT